jgi:hypothetical protein
LTAQFVASAHTLDTDPITGILVCVGYVDAFQTLLDSGKRWRYVILSDGCFSERVMAVAAADSSTEYYLAQPAFMHADYACDAYTAISATLERTFGNSVHSLIETRTPPHRLIAATLERLWPHRYKFLGEENQRGGYLVEKLSTKRRQSEPSSAPD